MTDATPALANTESHDIAPSDRVIALMAGDWAPDSGELPARDAVADARVGRRARLTALFPGETLVIPTGPAKVRSNDTDFVFRAGSDYAWLTGDLEPDGVLVLVDADATLYMPPRAGRETPAFFTDRKHGELWVGRREGLDEVASRLGILTAPLVDLPVALKGLEPGTVRVLRGFDPLVDALVEPFPTAASPEAPATSSDVVVPEGQEAPPAAAKDPEGDAALATAVAELKVLKDDFEIASLQVAVDATARGFVDCVRELPSAVVLENGERWIEGTFWRRARVEGNDVGYTSIAACGHHATTLHWVRNDGAVRVGDLALLDMGVEGPDLYTADVTRTIPVSGTYTPLQRKVHDLVFAAQEAGIAACVVGNDWLAPHHAAMAVISEALLEWGWITGSTVEECVKESLHRRWTLHGTSHMLGMDVHDCSAARNSVYRGGKLQAGIVMTVEPGFYVQREDLSAPAEFRGIGVRIEDDILITDDGPVNLSAALPRSAADTEAWMKALLPAGWPAV